MLLLVFKFQNTTDKRLSCLRILEIIRQSKKIKFYQASTSELYGKTLKFLKMKTQFNPTSPYSISKLYAYWIKHYRDAYNIFACNGILFNHESPRM